MQLTPLTGKIRPMDSGNQPFLTPTTSPRRSATGFWLRGLFFALLAANLALFVWLRQQPKPEPVVFSATDAGVPPLQLLSEVEPPANAASWHKAPLAEGENANNVVPVCFRIGPFSSQAAINQVLEPMQDFVIKTRSRRETASQEAGYWVFLPAAENRAAALKAARRLMEAGVQDYYVVTAGAHENTVSLGLYRDKSNAMSRLENLRQRGFDAQWEARLEQWPEYWLDVAVASDQAQKLPAILNEKAPDSHSFSAPCDW